MVIRSYASWRRPSLRDASELLQLFLANRQTREQLRDSVRGLLEDLRAHEALVRERTGIVLAGRRMLEIGPGQMSRQLSFFSVRNDVVGIDLDVVPSGVDPAGYWRVLQRNGPKRLVKTLVRKLFGFDRRFAKELQRQLELPRLPAPSVVQGDATRMEFADCSFDFVYSFDVFEHLPDPARVLGEIARVLRPGGGCLISVHLFTAEDGAHDLRVLRGRRGQIPYWAHLRPPHRELIHPSAYVNELRLGQWRGLFSDRMPGALLECRRPAGVELERELSRLREQGELADYSDEELLNGRLAAVWRKPA
jgi:SAM-dependent methyltransferase